jgi:hypothetical protein
MVGEDALRLHLDPVGCGVAGAGRQQVGHPPTPTMLRPSQLPRPQGLITTPL